MTMNKMCWALCVALVVAACGNSKGEEVIYIDAPDVGGKHDVSPSADASTEEDVGAEEEPRTDLEVLLLDEEVTFVNGVASRVAVTVPEGTVSLTVSVYGDRYHYGLSRWTNGDGSVLVPPTWVDQDPNAPSICLEARCPVQFAAAKSSFAAQLPNNEKLTVVPGTHNIDAYAFSMTGFTTRPANDTTAQIQVVAKRLPVAPADGILDINFYFTGARGWTAESAPTDEAFQSLLDEVGAIYEQANLTLGTITYNDIPEEYGVLENALLGDDIEELFALSAGAPRDAINVFMIEEIFIASEAAGNQLGIILGISGGIPGPPYVGSKRSGVVISSNGDPRAPVATSSIIAHEVGHHLGLFHTSEAQPGMHDPIGDTPENDTSMLMHANGSGATLSPTQGMVMRHNVWVRHGETP